MYDLLIAPIWWFVAGFITITIATGNADAAMQMGIAFAVVGLILAGAVKAVKATGQAVLFLILWLGPPVVTIGSFLIF